MFRGVPLVLVASLVGRGPAVLLTSALFALAHGINPGITPLAILNIGLAGVFLGFAFYCPGRMYAAFGAHLGWNGMLAVLQAPVSGLPQDLPWFDYHPGGPQWLTGGAFGPEGGVIGSLVVVAASGVMLRRGLGHRS
ncbi:MAG: CPBP family intramembrane glutamic endopeptidase [Gemmatimonadota bacterium]